MVDKSASDLARKRWKKATPEDRAEAAQNMLNAKSPEVLSAIGKKAAEARWKDANAKKAAKKAKKK